MANPLYAKYSIEDFDKFDCLKVSKGIFFTLLFALRGYVVWIMSVTNMKDRIGIMQWIYPDPKLFYLSLLSGLAAIYVVFVMSLRRPEASAWVQWSWRNLRLFLFGAVVFDLCVSFVAYYFWQMLSLDALLLQASIATVLILFCLYSKRIQINLSEFPQKIAD